MNNVFKTLVDLFKKMKSRQALKPIEAASKNESTEASHLPAELQKLFAELAHLILTAPKVPLTITVSTDTNAGVPNYPIQHHIGHRVYDENECRKISKKSRAFLTKMEKDRVLTPQLREHVVDQLMQLKIEPKRPVPLSYTKWVMFKILQTHQDPLGSNMVYFESLMQHKEMTLH